MMMLLLKYNPCFCMLLLLLIRRVWLWWKLNKIRLEELKLEKLIFFWSCWSWCVSFPFFLRSRSLTGSSIFHLTFYQIINDFNILFYFIILDLTHNSSFFIILFRYIQESCPRHNVFYFISICRGSQLCAFILYLPPQTQPPNPLAHSWQLKCLW